MLYKTYQGIVDGSTGRYVPQNEVYNTGDIGSCEDLCWQVSTGVLNKLCMKMRNTLVGYCKRNDVGSFFERFCLPELDEKIYSLQGEGFEVIKQFGYTETEDECFVIIFNIGHGKSLVLVVRMNGDLHFKEADGDDYRCGSGMLFRRRDGAAGLVDDMLYLRVSGVSGITYFEVPYLRQAGQLDVAVKPVKREEAKVGKRKYLVEGYDGSVFSIRDTGDGVVDKLTYEELIGVLQDSSIAGSLYGAVKTEYGVEFNLCYKNRYLTQDKQWYVVLLKPGDRFGRSLSTVIDKPTVLFYDNTSFKDKKQQYPLGQFVASYYLDTILGHTGQLCLNMEVPQWTVTPWDMDEIRAAVNKMV